jgi:hypothetical protein
MDIASCKAFFNLKSRVWKVSHHGMEDGFNADLLSWIQPEYCVIPIDAERSLFLHAHWDSLRSLTGASFHLTGDSSREQPLSLYKSSIEVHVGG